VLAEAARTMPHTLRRIAVDEEVLADLQVLVGFDDDLAAEATRLTNRIHGLLTQIHPALERVLGPKVAVGRAAAELLRRFGGPTDLRADGRRKLVPVVRKASPRAGEALIDALLTALDEQTVTVPGTVGAEKVLPRLAASLAEILTQRERLAAEVEAVLDAHPLAKVLTSMPGEHPPKGGNEQLKRAFFLAAFASPAIQSHGPTTTANEPPASATTPPSSAWSADASTSGSPCPATAPSTSPTDAGGLTDSDCCETEAQRRAVSRWASIRARAT
jgi:hypothetical protein